MSRHPLNLAARFLLEIAALLVMARWGWSLAPGWLAVGPAVLVPGVAAVTWGVFRVPNDGGAPTVEVAGQVRLLLEAGFFGAAVWMASRTGAGGWALPLGTATAVHYALSWDRVALLARGRPLPR